MQHHPINTFISPSQEFIGSQSQRNPGISPTKVTSHLHPPSVQASLVDVTSLLHLLLIPSSVLQEASDDRREEEAQGHHSETNPNANPSRNDDEATDKEDTSRHRKTEASQLTDL